MIDYQHEKDEDIDDKNDAIISKKERQYRERLRLTIGELKTRAVRNKTSPTTCIGLRMTTCENF